MNYWAAMLAALPVSGQRLVARVQRISLPRNADAATRLLRLRRALCRAANVRAVYETLDADVQAALQELRTMRGGLSPSLLQERYGLVRSWTQLAADPTPRSIAEQLVVRGWLLFRPDMPHHPARYMLPPELRRWLPRPLVLANAGIAPVAPPTPILAAAEALLHTCRVRPLRTRADGRLSAASLKRVTAAHHEEPATEQDLMAFCFPLLVDCGLLALLDNQATLTMHGHQFLRMSPVHQWAELHTAWLAAPAPDEPLDKLLIDRRGIDWPLLRRKLIAWIEALPAGVLLDPSMLYFALSDAFGPLGDTWTHGFRFVDRTPWQPRRAQALFDAALRGPLTWFGYGFWHHGGVCVQTYWARVADPQTHLAAVAEAKTATRHVLADTSPQVVLTETVVVQADPAVLADAVRARSVRRYLGERLAPGLAFVERRNIAPLTRALKRTGIHISFEEAAPASPLPAPAPLAPGDCAALLVACMHYSTHGLTDIPLTLHEDVERRLRAALTPALRQATEKTLSEVQLQPNDQGARADGKVQQGAYTHASPPAVGAGGEILRMLRRALRRRAALQVLYDTGGTGDWSERIVRPLDLWRQGDHWYLRAYCLSVCAERTFRLDRIVMCQLHDLYTSQRLSLLDKVMCRIDGNLADTQDLNTAHAGRIDTVKPHTIGIPVDEIAQPLLHRGELGIGQVAFKDTVLDMRAIAFEELEHFGSATIGDDIITDDGKHTY